MVPAASSAWLLLRGAALWPGSQQVARHNALVAATALADRRRERTEVEEFLAALTTVRRPPAARQPA
jgi:hypothetical protein